MSLPPLSRQRHEAYRQDFRERRTEGTRKAGSRRKQPDARRSFLQLFSAFWGMLRGFRLTMLFALCTVTISVLLNLVQPAAVKFVVDYVLGDESMPASWAPLSLPEDPYQLLTLVATGLIVLAVIAIAINIWGRWRATLTTKRLQSRLRKDVFEHAVRLPLHRIQQIKSGGVASILREDAGAVADLVFSLLYNPWRAITTLLGALVVLATIDLRLLAGAIILLPIIYLTHRTWIARIRPMYRDIRNTRQFTDSHATESFGGMRVVRSFSRQRSETSRFVRNNHLMIRQEINTWWWARGVDIAWSILIPAAGAIMLWYGGTRVLEGSITVGDLMAFLLYLAMLLEPLGTLAGSATAFQNSLAALDRILDLQEEPREMVAGPHTRPVNPQEVHGRITFTDVSFNYPGGSSPVLHDINLDVRAGEMIALVGPSGSGKSTLCNLVARFYDPTQGTVQLDGDDLREMDVEQYRRLLGIVEQDIFLFDGTVAENIGYAARQASMDEIINAARLANAHEFIEDFEHGYETIIGERGVRLSGGQRQRIAIARAILADPHILILDEATSNLDAESEQLIQQSLGRLLQGRTSFVIAHRLSTIRHADRIVVIDNGRIVEEGTHDELMRQSGRYEQLVFMQLDRDTPRPTGAGGTSHISAPMWRE